MPTEDHRATQKDADAPRGYPGVRAAFLWHLNIMGSTTAWFLLIIALITLLFNVLLLSGTLPPEAVDFMSYPLILATTSSIFLLVMGIIMPTYLETLLHFGLTRGQHALALLLVGAALTGGLFLISALMALIIGQHELLPGIPSFLVGSWLFFLTGWFIVIGYQYRRVITAVLSTLFGCAILVLGTSWPVFLFESSPTMDTATVLWLGPLALALTDSEVLSLVSAGILIVALTAAILALTRRIPIKV